MYGQIMFISHDTIILWTLVSLVAPLFFCLASYDFVIPKSSIRDSRWFQVLFGTTFASLTLYSLCFWIAALGALFVHRSFYDASVFIVGYAWALPLIIPTVFTFVLLSLAFVYLEDRLRLPKILHYESREERGEWQTFFIIVGIPAFLGFMSRPPSIFLGILIGLYAFACYKLGPIMRDDRSRDS